MLLPMLGACFAAMLVPTLLHDAPIYESLGASLCGRVGATKRPHSGAVASWKGVTHGIDSDQTQLVRAALTHFARSRMLPSGGRAYFLMNAAATLIAGFGLFEDSPAVIIGAMLIAALLGPIQGMAMALAESNLKLLRTSLIAEILGAALVLALGIALGTIDRVSPLGHEILARTAPNILDLLIGLVGGAAASFAIATPGLGSMAVGVAIATALVPPLTTCGILIARGLPDSGRRRFSSVPRQLGRHHLLGHGGVHDPGPPRRDRWAAVPGKARR